MDRGEGAWEGGHQGQTTTATRGQLETGAKGARGGNGKQREWEPHQLLGTTEASGLGVGRGQNEATAWRTGRGKRQGQGQGTGPTAHGMEGHAMLVWGAMLVETPTLSVPPSATDDNRSRQETLPAEVVQPAGGTQFNQG
jgi:hypothetical protein